MRPLGSNQHGNAENENDIRFELHSPATRAIECLTAPTGRAASIHSASADNRAHHEAEALALRAASWSKCAMSTPFRFVAISPAERLCGMRLILIYLRRVTQVRRRLRQWRVAA